MNTFFVGQLRVSIGHFELQKCLVRGWECDSDSVDTTITLTAAADSQSADRGLLTDGAATH